MKICLYKHFGLRVGDGPGGSLTTVKSVGTLRYFAMLSNEKKSEWARRELNPRPSPYRNRSDFGISSESRICRGDVIATRPRAHEGK